jgi:uncharacterized coiled-coil protein SlyX
MQKRVEELEVKIAFQEHTMAQLDEVVRELRAEVDSLRHELREIREQATVGEEDPDQRPPHY